MQWPQAPAVWSDTSDMRGVQLLIVPFIPCKLPPLHCVGGSWSWSWLMRPPTHNIRFGIFQLQNVYRHN